LPERGGRLLRVEIEPDQGAMHFFAQRVTREDALRAVDGSVVLAAARVIGQETAEDTQVEQLQALALDQAPVVVAICEEVATVERDSLLVERGLLLHRLRPELFGQGAVRLEVINVQPEATGRVEADTLGIDPQVRVIGFQRWAASPWRGTSMRSPRWT